MRFDDLTPHGQMLLAAWAVLTKSLIDDLDEVISFPGSIRLLGDTCRVAGMRSRKQHNNMRRNDLGDARSIRRKKFTPVKNRRPAKRKVSA